MSYNVTRLCRNERYLILSSIVCTRMLWLNDDRELEEIELPGFEYNFATILATVIYPDRWLQVTSQSVRIIDSLSQLLVIEWFPPKEKISFADCCGTSVVLICGRNLVYLLDCALDTFNVISHRPVQDDLSCITLCPHFMKNNLLFCAVGSWGLQKILILQLPTLEVIAASKNVETSAPRDIKFLLTKRADYLLAGYGTCAMQLFHK